MQFLYNILVVSILILAAPVLLYRVIREPEFAERLKQSLGFWPAASLEKVAGKGCVWLHAASVGEIVATSPIVKEIQKQLPGVPILISVITASGYDMARRIIPEAAAIIYFPLDLPWLTQRLVSTVQPRAFLMVETELWPNFLRAIKDHNIPAIMVNGRISDKSVSRYRHLRTILHNMLSTISLFCMQSAIDAEYIVRLGADPRRVIITGNTKFDQNYTAISPEAKEKLQAELGLTGRYPVVIAGSTHKGEEEMLFAAFKQIKKEYPQAGLILAPRDIMRTPELITLAESQGLTVGRRTEAAARPVSNKDVIILDTIGELGKVYSLGDVVFVGGSLVPTGGHNILEPAFHGKPILVGPHMFNFKETYTLFSKRQACLTVRDTRELTATLLRLIGDDRERKDMSERCLAIIRENQGAAEKSARYLRQVLAQQPKPPSCTKVRRREKLQLYLYNFAHRRPRGPVSFLLLSILRVLSWLYGAAVVLKLSLYKWGVLKQDRLPCTVISIGNITVGGTGKTPTAQRLAAFIHEQGYKVAVLNRGYRAKWRGEVGIVSDGQRILMNATDSGDEAYLLAKNLPGIPVIIGRKRAITGRYAVENLGIEVLVLDDGFQHWQLARDLDIVLIDTITAFGNNQMLPRGILREPLRHLKRAHTFLLTKVDQSEPAVYDTLKQRLARYNPEALVVESVHQPQYLVEIGRWQANDLAATINLKELQDRPVLAFSAIGNPASFERTIRDVGATVVEAVQFPDHHDYTLVEMQEIMQLAVEKGALALITTEKDAVKIPKAFFNMPQPLPLYVLVIEMTFLTGGDELLTQIKNTIRRKQSLEVKA